MAYSYNVDYWDGNSSVEISADMIKLRYANYPKDYFLGVLPASQYGSVAVLPSYYQPSISSNRIVTNSPSSDSGSPSYLINPVSGTSISTNKPNPSPHNTLVVSVNSDLSALSLLS